MGTTAVAAIVTGNVMPVGSAGDSRCYLLRDGKLTQITKDDSWVSAAWAEGILNADEIERHPLKNVITKAVGAKDTIEIDVVEQQLRRMLLQRYQAYRASGLGGIAPRRIRLRPFPGTATIKDVIRNKRCELVDGILVEKPMGYEESLLAAEIIRLLGNFVERHKLGLVAGEGGMLRLAKGLVRIPDVSFIATDRLPGGKVPRQPIPRLVPNLAVEVLSPSNTSREMDQKLEEYFDAGVELVWFVDPRARTVEVFTEIEQSRLHSSGETLTGAPVLPRFKLKLGNLFAKLDGG
jgi:Uma2 family endonuclease